VGSLEDEAVARAAVAGASALFALLPPKYDAPDVRALQRKLAENLAAAVEADRVPRVLLLSSVGAQAPSGTGPIAGLHAAEKRFERTGAAFLALRPAFFMENHLHSIGLVKSAGILGSALEADLAFPMIATRDIAAAAAEELLQGFQGSAVRELFGPRDYSMKEAASILGRAIGRPDLPYVRFSYEDAEKAMRQAGMSADVAGKYVEMYQAFNEGRVTATQPRSARSDTPTTLEEFAKTFAAAFGA
jgi:uncharacterized protein YbjT (DUF2867 family)